MSQTVAAGKFEEPLGVLLQLVERGQIEVSKISVSEITSRYLARIAEMDHQTPEEVSNFLELGARLLYIKSLALLPNPSADQQTEEIERLNFELAEYRQMQAAARALSARISSRTWPRGVVERLDPKELPYPNVSVTAIADAFSRALSRVEPAPQVRLVKRHLSQEAVIARLKTKLDEGGFNLQEIIDECRDRLEIIVTFLSLLELARLRIAKVVQDSQFAPIMVEPAGA